MLILFVESNPTRSLLFYLSYTNMSLLVVLVHYKHVSALSYLSITNMSLPCLACLLQTYVPLVLLCHYKEKCFLSYFSVTKSPFLGLLIHSCMPLLARILYILFLLSRFLDLYTWLLLHLLWLLTSLPWDVQSGNLFERTFDIPHCRGISASC